MTLRRPQERWRLAETVPDTDRQARRLSDDSQRGERERGKGADSNSNKRRDELWLFCFISAAARGSRALLSNLRFLTRLNRWCAPVAARSRVHVLVVRYVFVFAAAPGPPPTPLSIPPAPAPTNSLPLTAVDSAAVPLPLLLLLLFVRASASVKDMCAMPL